MNQRYVVWSLAISTFLVDQITKLMVLSTFAVADSARVLPGIWITHVRNTGALWGHAQGMNSLFILASVLALWMLIAHKEHFHTPLGMITLGLLIGGIAGNLLDRILLESVTDFIDLRWWPVFNVADSAIVSGVVLAVADGFRTRPSR